MVRQRTGGWTLPATGRARRNCAGGGRRAAPSARSLTGNSATGNSRGGPRGGSRTGRNPTGGSRSRNSPSGDSRSLLRRITRPCNPRHRKARPRSPGPGSTSRRPRNTCLLRRPSLGEIPFLIASTRPATATACGPGEWLAKLSFPCLAPRRGRAMRSTPLGRNRRLPIRPVPSRLGRVVCRCCLMRRLVRHSLICRQDTRLNTVASCRPIRPIRGQPPPLAGRRLCRAARLTRPRHAQLSRRPARWPARRRDMSPSPGRTQA